MLTALIAEDELLVRIGIASCVPWTELNIHVIGEVANGAEAWKLFQQHHPDIMIVDIRMPEMDGIELISRIRADGSHCAIIVVTSVENDEILRKLDQFNISAVLMKATMEQEDITEAVKKASSNLPGNRYTDHSISETENWMEYLNLQSPEPPSKIRGFLWIYFPEHANLSLHYRHSIITLFVHRLEKEKAITVLPYEEGALLLFSDLYPADETEEIIDNLNAYVRSNFEIQLILTANLNLNNVRNLPGIFREVRALSETFCTLPNPLILNDEGMLVTAKLNTLRNDLARFAPLYEKDDPLLYILSKIQSFPILFSQSISDTQCSSAEILKRLAVQDESRNMIEQIDLLCTAAERRILTKKQKMRPDILRAMDYIYQHQQSKLTVEQLANELGFHTVYFSKLFKTCTGISFSDYLTDIRIHRSKNLLKDKSKKLEFISYECGFSDVAYFCHRFKMLTGMTPSQWREQL